MTWGEFKAWVEARAVKDDDEIGFIDFVGDPNELSREPFVDALGHCGWVEIS